jgi:hypothetical protein
MKVDKDDGCTTLQFFQQSVSGTKRAIEIVHEHTTFEIQHGHFDAAWGGVDTTSPPWGSRRIVGRTQQAHLLVDTGQHFLFVPNMVAGGNDIDPGIKEFPDRIGGDPETGGGIFAVGDNQINIVSVDQPAQTLAQGKSPRLPDDITNK